MDKNKNYIEIDGIMNSVKKLCRRILFFNMFIILMMGSMKCMDWKTNLIIKIE